MGHPKMTSATMIVSKRLLERLAPEEPIADELGRCVLCYGRTNQTYELSDTKAHATNCPWVLAREHLKYVKGENNGKSKKV